MRSRRGSTTRFAALRLVEILRDKPFDDCLRDHVVTPLGLTHAANGPYEAILHRAAVGHIQPTPGAEPEPAPIWAMMPSMAPAGAMLSMRPRDLISAGSSNSVPPKTC
jgi:CubicO group peptidase (beta-lactamase class C family)